MRALLAALVLAGCGSGAVTDPSTIPPPPLPQPLVVSPPSAVTYPQQPTLFVISGGRSPYFVSSSNQAIVPNPSFIDNVFTTVPRNVTAQTVLTLTVRDSASASVPVQLIVDPLASAPLTARPTNIVFQGSAPGTCASGISSDIIVFGGQPPYTVSQPPDFQVTPALLTTNPGRVLVTSTGNCSTGEPLAIVDSLGAGVVLNVSNLKAPAVVTPPLPAFSVGPATVSLNSCTDSANVALIGGTGRYFAASGNSAVIAEVTGSNIGLIFRAKVTAGTTVATPVSVVFSDGASTQPVTVTLNAGATGDCQ